LLIWLLVSSAAGMMAFTEADTSGAARPAPLAIDMPDCPASEVFDSASNSCVAINYPCPSYLIDNNQNGIDDGDCYPLNIIQAPVAGSVTPAGPGLPTNGQATYRFPWPRGIALWVGVGCLVVDRQPYPRALVGVLTQLQLVEQMQDPRAKSANKNGLIDLGAYRQLGGGGYRIGADSTVTHPIAESGYLGELYGGGREFSTRTVLGLRYPGVDHVAARLEFRMAGIAPEWTLGLPVLGSTQPGGQARGRTVTLTYPYASYPQPAYSEVYSFLGPDQQLGHSLPAFKLQVETVWDLFLNVSWRQYYVSDSRYEFRQVPAREVWLGRYISFRAADPRDGALSYPAEFCNASGGSYIPVPVIEGQAALTR
jgi:hypothetical protein